MNTTTNKQDETLEEALSKITEFGGRKKGYNYKSTKDFAMAYAECAANWQKEQDKIILDGILKKFEGLKKEYDLMLQERDTVRKVSHDRKVIIDKLSGLVDRIIGSMALERVERFDLNNEAKELLQSLK